MAQTKRQGERTVFFETPPRVISSASIVGDVEGKGPLAAAYDLILEDDTWGESSWEKAECKMFVTAVKLALSKLGWGTNSLQCLLGGDLLNQIVVANYAARELGIPFLGLYSACSTCLLYTSDAADDLLCVDFGGRRILKKKKYILSFRHLLTLILNITYRLFYSPTHTT